MPQASAKLGVVPTSQAINRYFELSLYLLVLMGFGALASTGGLDLPSMLLVGTALALRGYLLAQRRRVVKHAPGDRPMCRDVESRRGADALCIEEDGLIAGNRMQCVERRQGRGSD